MSTRTEEMGTKGIVQKDSNMNPLLDEQVHQGLSNLRQLLAGKHLRPAELALTMIVVQAAPAAAFDVLSDTAAQSRWEVAHGQA